MENKQIQVQGTLAENPKRFERQSQQSYLVVEKALKACVPFELNEHDVSTLHIDKVVNWYYVFVYRLVLLMLLLMLLIIVVINFII